MAQSDFKDPEAGKRAAQDIELINDNASTVSGPKGQVSDSLYIDPVAERSYVRKLDLYLLPVLSIMYFCRFTTGGNIGNAKVRGFLSRYS